MLIFLELAGLALKNKVIQKAISHFGSQTAIAEKLGVKQSAVSQWLNNSCQISVNNALKIEKLTNGQFRAVDLCPKLKELEDLSPPKDAP